VMLWLAWPRGFLVLVAAPLLLLLITEVVGRRRAPVRQAGRAAA
jgi:hypothetical protein